MPDTIAAHIMKLQESTRELADQILEGAGLNGSSLTREELMELLSGKEADLDESDMQGV